MLLHKAVAGLSRRTAVIVLALAVGCSDSRSQRFGPSWNQERMKRGIHLIPERATVGYQDSTGEAWYLKGQHAGRPRWGGKSLKIVAGKLVKETDTYYGPPFMDEEYGGPLEAMLFVSFDYTKEAARQPPWEVSLTDADDQSGRSLSLDEVKRVLPTWGLSY